MTLELNQLTGVQFIAHTSCTYNPRLLLELTHSRICENELHWTYCKLATAMC